MARSEFGHTVRRWPLVGPVTLDCDVLTGVGPDLRIMVYTAEPGTEDAERLALLAVVGTQTLAAMSST
ncbi:MAG: hypothetical protein QOI90_618 [Mycobacterium sp.]|nr:hypothetical protein [Mycobacterium sp.]